MKTNLIVALLLFMACPDFSYGQASGNISYSQGGGRARAEQREHALRVLTKDELPPTAASTFVEASVMINVKADEYVAIFGITHEGETLADCSKKMDATVTAFTAELKSLGIKENEY